MSHESIGKLVDQWMADATFREALRKDPEGTVRKTGATLNQEEWQALKNMDWNIPDEELKARVSKGA